MSSGDESVVVELTIKPSGGLIVGDGASPQGSPLVVHIFRHFRLIGEVGVVILIVRIEQHVESVWQGDPINLFS